MNKRFPSVPVLRRLHTPLLAVFVIFSLIGGAFADNSDDLYRVRHFDGVRFYNPDTGPVDRASTGRLLRWVGRWLFGPEWSKWPDPSTLVSMQSSIIHERVQEGIVITIVGHATFLLQMDGINLLIDPIWSERCSPLTFIGPRRFRSPGIRLEDLPPLDAILITHNHYDHLDIATLEYLAKHRPCRTLAPLGNGALIRETGLRDVEELDWWDTVQLSQRVAVTLVPARHFSGRGLWDRDLALWGGYVVSGPSGNVYGAGDTGYGPHFSLIARRFAPLQAALLPISPYIPRHLRSSHYNPSHMHMGPWEAVRAFSDLKPHLSIAIHYQVFQLGPDGFEDAPNELRDALKRRCIKTSQFLTPQPGEVIRINRVGAKTGTAEANGTHKTSKP